MLDIVCKSPRGGLLQITTTMHSQYTVRIKQALGGLVTTLRALVTNRPGHSCERPPGTVPYGSKTCGKAAGNTGGNRQRFSSLNSSQSLLTATSKTSKQLSAKRSAQDQTATDHWGLQQIRSGIKDWNRQDQTAKDHEPYRTVTIYSETTRNHSHNRFLMIL